MLEAVSVEMGMEVEVVLVLAGGTGGPWLECSPGPSSAPSSCPPGLLGAHRGPKVEAPQRSSVDCNSQASDGKCPIAVVQKRIDASERSASSVQGNKKGIFTRQSSRKAGAPTTLRQVELEGGVRVCGRMLTATRLGGIVLISRPPRPPPGTGGQLGGLKSNWQPVECVMARLLSGVRH
ncbi:unnamed protein product [Gadus morhua 'NCC']